VILNDLSGIKSTTVKEINYLSQIEQNTRNQITATVSSIDRLSSVISGLNTAISTPTPPSVPTATPSSMISDIQGMGNAIEAQRQLLAPKLGMNNPDNLNSTSEWILSGGSIDWITKQRNSVAEIAKKLVPYLGDKYLFKFNDRVLSLGRLAAGSWIGIVENANSGTLHAREAQYLLNNQDVRNAWSNSGTMDNPAFHGSILDWAQYHYNTWGKKEGRAFKNGGYTGDIPQNNIAGVVHGQEYVIDAPTTKDLDKRIKKNQ